MDNIVRIIDMDGFRIGKKFYCKELGILDIEENEAISFIFNLGIKWEELSEKEQRQCIFLTEKIHKLPFHTNGETLELESLNSIVSNFHKHMKKDENSTLAYKGGTFERDLLASLNIPSVNLEQFGCPKATALFDDLIWLETCGQHLGELSYLHCPKVEVEAFGNWLKKELSWEL